MGWVYSRDGRGVWGVLIIIFSVFFHNTLLEAPSSLDKTCRVSAVAATVPGFSPMLHCTVELLVKNGNHSCALDLKLHLINIKTLW